MSTFIELPRYRHDDGREPVTDWLEAIRDKTTVWLLCGGDKASQAADIRRARKFRADWKLRQQ